MTDEITIRCAESPADYLACQAAQRRAWGLTDEGYVVPVATMAGAQLHGGLLIAEWEPTPRPRPEVTPEAALRLPRLIETTRRPDGAKAVDALNLALTEPLVLLEIPDDIQRLRTEEPSLAESWALAVRRAF